MEFVHKITREIADIQN